MAWNMTWSGSFSQKWKTWLNGLVFVFPSRKHTDGKILSPFQFCITGRYQFLKHSFWIPIILTSQNYSAGRECKNAHSKIQWGHHYLGKSLLFLRIQLWTGFHSLPYSFNFSSLIMPIISSCGQFGDYFSW